MPRLQISPDQSKDPEGQGGGGAKYTLPCKQPEKANDDEIRESKGGNDKQTETGSSNVDGAQVNFQSNSRKTFNKNKAAKQTESKPNTKVDKGEVKQQPRRVYKFVANNFRFRRKYNIEPVRDNSTIIPDS